jgi:hypothetical protein
VQKLAIIVLGRPHSGKSTTWYRLFGRTIRTGMKRLRLSQVDVRLLVRNSSPEESRIEIGDFVELFVKNSSFEEMGEEIEDYFDLNGLPSMILCSVQYTAHGIKTIEWFKNNGYDLYIQWLNPGHGDKSEYDDSLGFRRFESPGRFHVRSGRESPESRVAEIRDYLTRYV